MMILRKRNGFAMNAFRSNMKLLLNKEREKRWGKGKEKVKK